MEVKNTLQDEIILMHTTSAARILAEAGGDAFALYAFYAYTATRQGKQPVKATDTFCMKGLNWGKNKFYKAKKALEEMGMIETKTRRKNGKITGHYILVHYIGKSHHSPVFQRVEKPEGGKRETNTEDKNINTEDKKRNTSGVEKYSKKDLKVDPSVIGKPIDWQPNSKFQAMGLRYAQKFGEENDPAKVRMWFGVAKRYGEEKLNQAYSFVADYPNTDLKQKAKLFMWRLANA